MYSSSGKAFSFSSESATTATITSFMCDRWNTENLYVDCHFVMAAGPINERNQEATIYVGGLDERVTESLLWEFFIQAGQVQSVHMPRDRITQMPQGYGFVEFSSERDADYAIKIMNMIKIFNKPIRVNKPSAHHKNLDIGANLFIGNLDPEIDEKYLYDTFSAFGVILQTPKIMRDPDTGMSKGIAFINFASFEASDSAMEALNGQFLSNRAIRVSYSFKKDGRGERHGTASERLLASKKPVLCGDIPHQNFSDAPVIPEFISSGAQTRYSGIPQDSLPIIERIYQSTINMPGTPHSLFQLRHPMIHQDSRFPYSYESSSFSLSHAHIEEGYVNHPHSMNQLFREDQRVIQLGVDQNLVQGMALPAFLP